MKTHCETHTASTAAICASEKSDLNDFGFQSVPLRNYSLTHSLPVRTLVGYCPQSPLTIDMGRS